ncbi:M4 family metallopeptidase [Mycobacterium sp. Y57]|uniref:M4 family metallopeptidase n=1 Tax=Mycolicibacterium xanthum TaxID=2796469 RepID=UPI001C843DA7|nr:M4 family metallopeptidase [Mycolicibacterium xanthum]MBX7431549.1 M4 family metallopeptidase [Mycolicibacterium xanthum]
MSSVIGHGVAAAAPVDPSGPSETSSPAESDTAAEDRNTADDAADAADAADTDEDVAAEAAEDAEAPTLDAEGDDTVAGVAGVAGVADVADEETAEPAEESTASGDDTDEVTGEPESDGYQDSAEGAGSYQEGAEGTDETVPARASRVAVQPADEPATDDEPGDVPAADEAGPVDKAEPADEPAGTAEAPVVSTAAIKVRTPASVPIVHSLAAPRPVTLNSRPVTPNSIVTDLLTWVGLAPVADGLPVPATPVSTLVESLWLAVRQLQYTFNNQRPTAEATVSGPGPDGVVTGGVNAVDFDDTALTYTVTVAPTHGRVVVDESGNFTYTPDTPGAADQFTVAVGDSTGNPFHIHGLLGLLGVSAPTQVVITIAAVQPVQPARQAVATVDLTELLSSGDVALTSTDEGAVRVIEGTFTDQIVTSADDAAAVMNSVAPVLGASAGFADADHITTTTAGVGNSVETFYRYTETVGGVTVLGSDVILVTDADGTVTSLFNNYVGLAESFDVTPDVTVDEQAELDRLASVAYLGADVDPDVLTAFMEQNTFTSTLVVYALDDQIDPSLAWRVVVVLPDTGDMSSSGATYVIDADGADAGTILVTTSNLQDVTVSTVATDYLGASRSITVDEGGWLYPWFPTYSMVDAERNLTTYQTSYPLFGLLGPVLPGKVVKRGWFGGWDTSAVSAQANTALVYDYFADVLGRTSFDGQGAPILVSIRYTPNGLFGAGYANAFWDPPRQQFAFGNSAHFESAVDIVAHEFTHAVVSYVVGTGGSVLDYGESGALNEAYADIFGVLIEGDTGPGRWLIGEDSEYTGGVVRNLADPTSISTSVGAYRDNYASRYTGTGDDGGEHLNSTIFSHAAYLMMTDPVTAGISDDTWAAVFYHSLFRLSDGATFTDGRAAVLSSAAAQGFTDAELDAIRDAFDEVGIGSAATLSSLAA